MRRPLFLSLLMITAITLTAKAQHEPAPFSIPTTNPKAVVQQQLAATLIEVTYHRPGVKGRVIFGQLVPFDAVWRTGADAATQISFSTPVTFGGAWIAAGSYELYTIPGRERWEVILQPAAGSWGSYDYDPANDTARVGVSSIRAADPVETLTIAFEDVTNAATTLAISWDQTRVTVPITVDVRATVVPQLEAALAAEGRRPYFQAAMFYYDHNLELPRAAQLMRLALEANPNHVGMLYRLALILAKGGERAAAIETAQASLAAAKIAEGRELQNEYIRLNRNLLQRLGVDQSAD